MILVNQQVESENCHYNSYYEINNKVDDQRGWGRLEVASEGEYAGKDNEENDKRENKRGKYFDVCPKVDA